MVCLVELEHMATTGLMPDTMEGDWEDGVPGAQHVVLHLRLFCDDPYDPLSHGAEASSHDHPPFSATRTTLEESYRQTLGLKGGVFLKIALDSTSAKQLRRYVIKLAMRLFAAAAVSRTGIVRTRSGGQANGARQQLSQDDM